jgi:hypothetical protein
MKAEVASDRSTGLRAREARLEKARKGHQGHPALGVTRNAARGSKAQEGSRGAKAQRNAPAILDANPGLEDAIKHVSQPASKAPSEEHAKAAWLDTVARAIPDVEHASRRSGFRAKAARRRPNSGRMGRPDHCDSRTVRPADRASEPKERTGSRRSSAKGLRSEVQEAQRDGSAWRFRRQGSVARR